MQTGTRYRFSPSRLIIIVLLCGLGSCKPAPQTVSSVIDNPCSPPCWQQIVPGTTQRADILPLLNAIPGIQTQTIKSTWMVEPEDSIRWSWETYSQDSFGQVFFRNDIVTMITIFPKEEALHFSDVIEAFGEPEQVLAVKTIGERNTFALFLFYVSKGYGFVDYGYLQIHEKNETIQITADNDVKYFWVGEQDNLYRYMTEGQLQRYPLSFIEEALQPWNSYGEYILVQR